LLESNHLSGYSITFEKETVIDYSAIQPIVTYTIVGASKICIDSLFQTSEVRNLDQIMKSSPEKRDSILSNMKEALAVLVDK